MSDQGLSNAFELKQMVTGTRLSSEIELFLKKKKITIHAILLKNPFVFFTHFSVYLFLSQNVLLV